MMRIRAALSVICVAALQAGSVQSALADPEMTVRAANQTLQEIMAIPGRQIPAALLAEAHGVAIIPNVIKVGFIAGVRRGHGVVLVRGPDSAWSLPQFVTITGGSVGWQAGIQGTDVVLVFTTRKGVDGLLRGKFTIGADAAAAAGPVGRNAAAATDARLRAEILSYSRSRGLFVGVSLDGSAIEIDPVQQTNFYGSGPGQPPARVPDSATQLIDALTRATQGSLPAIEPATTALTAEAGPGGSTAQQSLARSASQLFASVDEPWRQYLALPAEVFTAGSPPNAAALESAQKRYDLVAADPQYRVLAARPEFQSTRQFLGQLIRDSAAPPAPLPPPPTTR